jgi:ribosome-associated protein
LERQAPPQAGNETRIVQKHPTPSADQSSTNPSTYHRDDLPPPLQRALEAALDKSARRPVILNVTDITGYTDWVLIVSGRSDRHVQGIAEGIADELEAEGVRPKASEGGDHTWDLLDYDDFMVHVFYHPVRMHFDLESMWSDAPRVVLDLPAEVMDTTDLDSLSAPNSLPAYRGDLIFGGFEDEFAD